MIGQLHADNCDYHAMYQQPSLCASRLLSYLHVEPTMQISTVSGMRWHGNKAKRNTKILNIVFSVFVLWHHGF